MNDVGRMNKQELIMMLNILSVCSDEKLNLDLEKLNITTEELAKLALNMGSEMKPMFFQAVKEKAIALNKLSRVDNETFQKAVQEILEETPNE